MLVLPCISYELFRAKHDVSLRVVPEMSLGSGHSSWVRASPILLLIEIGHKLVPDLGIRALAYRLLRKRANQFFIPVHGCSGHLDCFALVRSRATVVCLVLEIKTFKAVCHQICLWQRKNFYQSSTSFCWSGILKHANSPDGRWDRAH